jgi:putative NADH-flavin reductase
MRQITIFGASGKVGRQVVALALQQGYRVVAFVHSQDPFAANDKLKVVKGDIRDRAAVAAALSGSSAAISTLGSWGTRNKNVVTTGMRAIIPAMEQIGITRLVTVTGAGARWSGDRPGFLDRLGHVLLRIAAAKILQDGEEHLRLLDESRLEWTCLRSPVMSKRRGSDYRLDLQPPVPWAAIPRPAVAQALVIQLKNLDYVRSAPFIHRR